MGFSGSGDDSSEETISEPDPGESSESSESVKAAVGVAPHVVPPLEDQDPLAEGGTPLGRGQAVESGTHDDYVSP